ncbi:MAG: hypothetical protein JXB48_22340 [Candidatus Latescibacteria bacterium]|nr:hypothetical protein [Candidatus Latescibacterota bacterium]
MIRYTSKGLWYQECYFEESFETVDIDILEYRYRSRPLPRSLWRYSFTHLIDLRIKEEQILSNFTPNLRYQIRKAKDREGIEVNMVFPPNNHEVDEFIHYFNTFSQKKVIGSIGQGPLNELVLKEMFGISSAFNREGHILTMHGYLVHKIESRVLLLYSVSPLMECPSNKTRNVIGGANRYLHYNDMLFFKNAGIRTYDFGGFYIGSTDKKLLDINRFKKMFGGSLTVCYSGEKACSLKGRIYLFFREVRDFLFKRKMLLQNKERKRDGNLKLKELSGQNNKI